VDSIFITPGVGIVVNEKGSILKKCAEPVSATSFSAWGCYQA
jgi:hypothetical protein